MIPHPRSRIEGLSPEDCAAVHAAALRILDEAGLAIQSEECCRRLAEAGARVDFAAQRVRLDPGTVERHLAMAPRRWTLHARNPAKSVEVGADRLLVAPGYGSPFVADAAGRRRSATMADFERFAALAGRSEAVDVTGGLLVEPLDVPPELRALETTRALLTLSDKPLLGSVAGAAGARESLELARIVFGDIRERPVLLGLININSPLRLDSRMAEAFLEYAGAGQPVLLTPGILMGVTAPVTPAGALAQAFAEILGCAALAQIIHPGTPVIAGIGGFGADLRSAGPGFGRPENALGTVLGAQMARRLGLPFRCSAAVTGARLPDCRSGYERMMTALAAWSAGAHLCLQGAGTLDSISSMCYEQFAIDTEIWGYLRRLAAPVEVSAETLAVELVASRPSDYLGCEHTAAHMRGELLAPGLVPVQSYDEWLAAGGRDVAALARERLAELPGPDALPPLDPDAARELAKHVRARREGLAAGR